MQASSGVIAEIESRVNIVDLISRYVSLKPAGASFKGLCPFHPDKNPSFFVSPDKGYYHCFGCGVGGGAVNFIRRMEGLSFAEALQILAAEVGVSLTAGRAKDSKASDLYREKENLYSLNRVAADYYIKLLWSETGSAARAFLSSRRIGEEEARKFQLGCASDSWDALLNHLRRLGFSDESIAGGGLAAERRSGDGYYDRFRNRLIFPIIDGRDRVIGFGGRLLEDSDHDAPKYLNSPETQVYLKRDSLYGLNLTRKGIAASGQAVIVEGYVDLISLYQGGVANVVASLGTSLSEGQAEVIRRYAREAIILYDADSAGEAATSRGLDILLGKGLSVKVASLPEGHDPDSFIRQEGGEALLERLHVAIDLFDYRLTMALKNHDLSTTDGKKRLSDDIIANLLKFKNDVQIEDYIRKTQELLRRTSAYLDETALRSELRKALRRTGRGGGENGSVAVVREKRAEDRLLKAERAIVRLMLKDHQIVNIVQDKFRDEDIGVEVFSDPKYREIASLLLSQDEKGGSGQPVALSSLEDDSLSDTVSALLFEDELGGNWEEGALGDMIRILTDKPKLERWKELEGYIREALTKDKPVEPEKASEYQRLTRYFKGSRKT